MKVLIAFIAAIILGVVAHLFLPWWTIAIVCFLIGLAFIEKTSHAILVGFVSVFLIWGLAALFKSYQNDFVLLNRMSDVLPFQYPLVTLIVTAVLGGIIGMFSTLSGYYLQTIKEKKRW